ncbi:PEP-CTERM protein-sorting domain-containing protein [Prosthecobacter debontii]|uniref:PEP-CTERM protein-sorting domain-containing protein n=1 Tax=Prosthecobacter debontii TaxID=48467 RepID=A0A1T4YR48_9BACT|nr:autotransporter-associated beta strand repeat-containing protein [Prosthecobacter debontii]SKB04229.1 PEP-CTERM protein-sorting domain-containing protein [Prosthecobacter debontii]
MKLPSFLLSFLTVASITYGQTYQFDGDLGLDGIQNGGGNWSTNSAVSTNLRWLKDGSYSAWDNSGLAIAEFGNTTSTSGGAITVEGEIKLAGMTFNTLGSSLGSLSHSFSGGTLNFGTSGIINIANGASGGGTGNQWITFTSALKGQDLTFQKSGGANVGFARISAVNSELTGTLTLKSAPGATSGIYLSVGSPNYIAAVSAIDVQNYSVFNPTGAGTYAMAISMAGAGSSNYGAIRVDASNTIFSGAITMTADSRLHTHINVLNTTISGGIGESGGSWAFNRTAYSPVNTISALTTNYTTASTYTGSTIFGRAVTLFSTSESIGTEGGTNVLDFTAATAPTSDLLYHGQTAGGLQLIGGLATPTVLRLQGDIGEDNVQNFSSLSVQQSATAIQLSSGVGGSMNLNLGPISRTGNAVLAINAPVSGVITATGSDGLIGTWATYRSADGKLGSWASLTNGVIGSFSGDLVFANDNIVNGLAGYSAQSHLAVTNGSDQMVSFIGAISDIASISMLDTSADRLIDFYGTTLRLGATGGIQIVTGAKMLEIGTLGDGSILTAGGASNTAGQLMLTNMSNNGSLQINSVIANNGSGAVSLNINGTGKTILTAANTFTGTVVIHSGALEIQNNTALGTTAGGTKVMAGGSLNLPGNITLAETIQVNGHGVNLDGAIRNLSGTNTITPTVRMQSSTRIASDSGTLILAGGLAAQISATGLTFSGAGNIEVRGNITAASGLLTKEGSGTVTLFGSSTASGNTTITNGVLHLNFNNGTAPASNMLANGATLSTTIGVLVLGGGKLQMTGLADGTSSQSFGALALNSGSSSLSASSTGTGSATINLAAITRNIGATLNFTLPTSGEIRTTSGTNNALLTGTGGVAYATVGLSDWAATGTLVGGVRPITGLSTLGLYTASTASSLTGNADIAATITGTSLSANTAISSLRFNQAQATTITLNATDRILSTGGILVTPNVGANTTTITGGSIRAAQGSTDLVIFQNNTAAPLVISSRILNALNAGGTAAVASNLTKTGAGTLVLEYNQAYVQGGSDMSGGVRIQDGALQLSKTVSTAISYYIYAGTTFTLGSGSTSGKLILGSASNNYAVTAYGGLRIEGSGTGNAVVGGTSASGIFLHYVTGVADFRAGMIGGTGTNENNLNLQISLGTLQLGPANTFNGKTSILQNTIEATTLADRGLASSLGTGDSSSTTHIIDIATATTSAKNFAAVGTLRYIGSTDSVTNRPLNVTNGDIPEDVSSVTAVLENTGTGTVKFTTAFTAAGANTVDRLLRLGGTNTGANEIVSYADASVAVSKVEKVGTGTWIMTGASTYSGGTTVDGGTLLVTNTTGSGTGSGTLTVNANGVFGGSGRVTPAADKNIDIIGGTLQVGTELPGYTATAASTLTLQTSGTGSLNLTSFATIAFDLFSGAGLGNNTGLSTAADLAIILGNASFSSDTLIRVSNPNGMTQWAVDDQWRIFDWTNLSTPITNTVNYDLPSLPEGLAWDTSALFDTGVLSIISATVVPEPSRMLLLAFGMMMLTTYRKRSVKVRA